MEQSFSQTQKNSQNQLQRMGQWQINSLNLLAMSAEDLRDEIYAQAEKNPALEICGDGFESGVKSVRLKANAFSDYTRVGTSSSLGEEKSQAFQEILESRPDERKTLYAHLMEQLSVTNVNEQQAALCKKIIGNLDEKGFFILAPASLLSAGQSTELLEQCMEIVRSFDPSGICVANIQESLFVQARQKRSPPKAALFLLDGHFDFLDPPAPQKILKKIKDFISAQKKLSFNTTDFSTAEKFTEDDVQNALDFIRTLDPLPARNFSVSVPHFVVPDIFVEKNPDKDAADELPFKVRVSDKFIPRVRISSDFAAAQNSSEFAKSAVKQANIFLESLEFRETTIARAASVIVEKQLEFFKRGTGHLVPLRQQDVAQAIGVHESTISRMALSKYIQCDWGLFPVKYFFTNAIARPSNSGGQESAASTGKGEECVLELESLSQENVKVAIGKILAEHAADKKKLSDQKIAGILAERGIKVARRTVAKYRAHLNIGSSYKRS